ncbi:MAG: acyltransferase, partial [Rhodocyclaceae bacterium]|nr:acyltransferase [Rhodocyclaceae bacterium]
MRPSSPDFRKDINGLRAIAVMAVMLFHFRVTGFSGGFVGVDVFFVISGYLMTRLILGPLSLGRFSVLDFYLARARRIFPALAALCSLLLAYGWFSLSPMDYQQLAKHAGASLLFISNHTYWKESGYFDADAHEKWLLHTWSLSVEWQF